VHVLITPKGPRKRRLRLRPAEWTAAREAARRRKTGRPAVSASAVTASVALHVGILAALVLEAPRPSPSPPDACSPMVELLAPVSIALEPVVVVRAEPAAPDDVPPPVAPPPIEPMDMTAALTALAVFPGLEDDGERMVEAPPETPDSPAPPPALDTDPTAAIEYWASVRARIAAVLRYPPHAERPGWTGGVTLDLQLDALGAVVSAEVLGDAPPAFVDAVRHAVVSAATFGPPPPGAPRRARIPIRFAPDAPRRSEIGGATTSGGT